MSDYEQDDYYFDDEAAASPASEPVESTPAPTRAEQQAQADKVRYEQARQTQGDDGTIKKIVEGVASTLTQQQEAKAQQALINEYAAKYPQLVEKSNYIAANVEQLRQVAVSQGKPVDFKALLDGAITKFEADTGLKFTESGQNEAIRNAAFSLDVGNAPPKAQQDTLTQAVDALDVNTLLSFSDKVLHSRG